MSDKKGYQNFGSFFTDDVEVLVRQPVDQFFCPPRPFNLLDLKGLTAFGTCARKHFLLDFKDWTFLNHGAFGATCKAAHNEAENWRLYCETQPLRFLDRELFPHVIRVLRELAFFVHCQPEDLVLLPNATTGLNTVIQNISLAPGDKVYMLDVGYGSVKKMAQVTCAKAGATVVQGELKFPIRSSSEILRVVEQSIPEGTKLAIFDAVTSNTAVKLPLQELIALCHRRGIPVLVDGAHALGMLELNLDELGVDYFVANCHKWLCAPKGSAMLWVRRSLQPALQPLVISHGIGRGFTSDFIWDGCRDYSSILGVSSALRLWQTAGPDNIRQYMTALLKEAVELLEGRWGTGTLVPLEMCGSMALVCLPSAFNLGEASATSTDAKTLQDVLYSEHVEVPVKCVQGVLYVRLSVHIYNTIEDYAKLADVVALIEKNVAQ